MNERNDPRLGPQDFDAANQIYNLWLRRKQAIGPWRAWKEVGHELRAARRDFDGLANDQEVDRDLRVMAATNAANTLDEVGRSFEALEGYDGALGLVPGFPMAVGNRGMTLARQVPWVHEAHGLLRDRATRDLQEAIASTHIEEPVRKVFQGTLDRLVASRSERETLAGAYSDGGMYSDPHAEWAFQNSLLLVGAQRMRPPEQDLDPIHIKSVRVPIDAAYELPESFVAVNAIKRDYVTARYLAWLAITSPAEARLGERGRITHYVDPLDYSTWDLRSGLLAVAYGAAVDLADKIGTFLVLWLGLPQQVDRTDDRNWFQPPRGLEPRSVAAGLDAVLTADGRRLAALLGLVDQAQDKVEGGPRRKDPERALRDAGVHRFLVLDHMGDRRIDGAIYDTTTDELSRAVIEALRTARRMLLQTIVAVAQKERLGPPGLTVPTTPYRTPPGG